MLIHQPKGSRVCGQIAVAHILGISLEQSLDLFGHCNCTSPKDVARVLRAQRYRCPTRLKPVYGTFRMRTGLAKLAPPRAGAGGTGWRSWTVWFMTGSGDCPQGFTSGRRDTASLQFYPWRKYDTGEIPSCGCNYVVCGTRNSHQFFGH